MHQHVDSRKKFVNISSIAKKANMLLEAERSNKRAQVTFEGTPSDDEDAEIVAPACLADSSDQPVYTFERHEAPHESNEQASVTLTMCFLEASVNDEAVVNDSYGAPVYAIGLANDVRGVVGVRREDVHMTPQELRLKQPLYSLAVAQ
jgi:hypothetical protein